MKAFLNFIFLFFLVSSNKAQVSVGRYADTGYYFHPSASSYIYTNKELIQVSANRYQLTIANIGNTFQFDIDGNNNLINWSTSGSIPVYPASDFMTLDNPGNFSFNSSFLPGTVPYIQNIYNNRYDPVTKTFYLHYGWGGGSTDQIGYSRQVYEKLVYTPAPEIYSVEPLTATPLTEVTVKGKGFSYINNSISYSVSFGGAYADSIVIVSDSIIKAWVGYGASGNVSVVNYSGIYSAGSFPGFVYVARPQPESAPWQYVGTPGFSNGRSYAVNAAIDGNNIPYVAFIDSADRKARVVKYENNNWINVGPEVSDGKCSLAKIIIDTANNPIVAFADSTIAGQLRVKKYNGSSWADMALPYAKGYFCLAAGKQNKFYLSYNETDTINLYFFDGQNWNFSATTGRTMPSENVSLSEISMAIDKNNIPYILYMDTSIEMNVTHVRASVIKASGASWMQVGIPSFTTGSDMYFPSISVDKNNIPTALFQDDDGFERLGTYKFEDGTWNPSGRRFFSESRSQYPSFAVDSANKTIVVFIDLAYKRGTVMTLNDLTGMWDTIGNRGFLPCTSLEEKALLIDKNNNALIAFADESQNGKVSVMKLVKDFIWVGGTSTAWENPANWNTGIVPSLTSNVFINAGGVVTLNSNTTINSITINPSASLTIFPGNTLTIVGH